MTDDFRYCQEVPKYFAPARAGGQAQRASGKALEAQIIADAIACAEQCNAAPIAPLDVVVAWKPSEVDPDRYVRAEVVIPAEYYPYVNPELVGAVASVLRGWVPEELTAEFVAAMAEQAVRAVRLAGRLTAYESMGHRETAGQP